MLMNSTTLSIQSVFILGGLGGVRGRKGMLCVKNGLLLEVDLYLQV